MNIRDLLRTVWRTAVSFTVPIILCSVGLADASVGVYTRYSRMGRITGDRFLRARGPSGYGIGL